MSNNIEVIMTYETTIKIQARKGKRVKKRSLILTKISCRGRKISQFSLIEILQIFSDPMVTNLIALPNMKRSEEVGVIDNLNYWEYLSLIGHQSKIVLSTKMRLWT